MKIKTEHSRNAAAYADPEGNTSLSFTRNSVCRTFLGNQGFTNVVNLLDSEFKSTAVFPVSAIGHEAAEGKTYEPWGVMQAAFWILKQADTQSKVFFNPIAALIEKYSGEELSL